MMDLYLFLAGAAAFGFFACGLLFFRFWLRGHETLFLAFAAAFTLLGSGQAIQALGNIPTEERGAIYLIRLLAFGIIIAAILRKNWHARDGKGG